jgi:AraC-like DNA-binding protein
MASRGGQILTRDDCVHEIAAVCQRFVGAISIVEPVCFMAAVRRLVDGVPAEQTPADNLFIWNTLSTNAMRGAVTHHQLFHRWFGGICAYAPVWLPLPNEFSRDAVVPLLVRWAEACARDFDRSHRWPIAVQAAALLQRDPLHVWYIPELARAAGASPSTLERNFREIYRTSPQEYQSTLRVRRTAEVLRRDAGSLEGVVLTAGWPSVKEFSRVLRKRTGTQASALRQFTNDEFATLVLGPLELPIPGQAQPPSPTGAPP